MKVKGIMLHSTGANNPYLSRYVGPDDGHLGKNIYNNHWNQKMSRGVCAHAFIGYLKDKNGIATYQTLPWDHRGWHAGSGRNGSANDGYVSVEICEDGLKNKTYAMAALKEAKEWTAHICKLYGLNPLGKDVIIDHARGYAIGIASNHGDILHWYGKWGVTLDSIRKDVKAIMDKDKPEPAPDSNKKLYRVQVGAFSVKNNAENYKKQLEKDGYPAFIVEVNLSDDKSKGTIKVGSSVKVKSGAKTYDGKSGLAAWVYTEVFLVQRIEADRVWIGFEPKGATTATVKKADLILQ